VMKNAMAKKRKIKKTARKRRTGSEMEKEREGTALIVMEKAVKTGAMLLCISSRYPEGLCRMFWFGGFQRWRMCGRYDLVLPVHWHRRRVM